MATNIVHEDGNQIGVVCTAPTTPNSGDPVLVGQLPGVALTGKDTVTSKNTVKFNGTANFPVRGYNGSANTAINVGDVLYYKVGQTGSVLGVDSSGVRFGVALGAVTSGSTTTTLVRIGY